MILDLKFVPVAQEHGIDVIDEVGDRKEDIAAGEPMPGQREQREIYERRVRNPQSSFIFDKDLKKKKKRF